MSTKTAKSHYEVKWQQNGEVRYGVAQTYSKEAKAALKLGNLIVEDAILPVAYSIKESDVTDLPTDFGGEYDKYVEQEYKKAARLASQNPRKGVHVNDLFEVGVADGKAMYVVTAVNGTKCKIEWRGFGGGDRYQDQVLQLGGTFPTSKIKRLVEGDKAMAEIFSTDKSDDWYDSLEIGQIVHSHHGGGEFTRCEVVVDEEKGEKSLKPIALVGTWGKHDLPHRYNTGEIYYPYDADKVIKGKLMRPRWENIFESPQFKKDQKSLGRNYEAPGKLPALDLTVPPMTPEEEKQAALWQAVNATRAALEEQDHIEPSVRLARAKAIIEAALT